MRYAYSRTGKHHHKRKINYLLQKMDGNMSSEITQETEIVKKKKKSVGGKF